MATTKEKHRWSTARFVIGIISIVLFFVIGFQSFVVLIDHALSSVKDISGMLGFLVALLVLAAGITAIIIRNAITKGGPITCIIFYWLSTLVSLCATDNFLILKLWGVIAFAFGVIVLISIMKGKTRS
jgi:hypothetical protein